jgi:hypothetical protein
MIFSSWRFVVRESDKQPCNKSTCITLLTIVNIVYFYMYVYSFLGRAWGTCIDWLTYHKSMKYTCVIQFKLYLPMQHPHELIKSQHLIKLRNRSPLWSFFFFFFWRTIGLRISPYQKFAELRQEFVAPFNSNFHNKTLCESGVMWITRFVTYLSIAFHIYLL